MNILFICTHLYPCKIGGVELFNYYLINALGMNHHLWVITSCDINFNKRNINVIKIIPKKFGLKRLYLVYEHSRHILKLRGKIDVIHVPYMSRSWVYGCYLPLLKKIFNLSYILSIHGGGMYPWRPKFLHKFLFKYADAIISVSNILKREYEKRSGREIRVIPPLIPFKKSRIAKLELKEKYGFKRNDKIVLSLGSIKKIKGSDILLNAFSLLGKDYIESNHIRLLYVGDGIMRKDLEGKVKNKGFEKYVKFFGIIPHEKIPEMFKLADVYVIPSLFEATPISLLEAMFNGLAIIGTDTSGIKNLITDNENGLLFEKNNCMDLISKIKKLICETESAEKLGNKAKESYNKKLCNFEIVVNDHIKIYEQIIRNN